MAELVRDAQLHALTRALALDLVTAWRPRSTFDGIHRIRTWVRRHMRFINEPVEILHGPVWMIRTIVNQGRVWGDCDDAAMLAATIGNALGLPARFVAIRPTGAPEFVHVFTELDSGRGAWLCCDPTANVAPPLQWDRMILNV